jgi:hypothetical protein
MSEIDLGLRQLAGEIEYPPTPPIARDVMRRLEQGSRASGPPARHRARLLGSRGPRIAVAAASTAALLAVVPILFLGGSGEVQPAAAEVLRQVAAVAAVQEADTRPGPGQYFFTRSREASVATTFGVNTRWSALYPKERETWTAPDGTIRFRVTSQKPELVSAAQRAAWVAAGSPPLRSGQVSEESIKGANKFLDTSNLPTEPKALRESIEARKAPEFVGPPGEAETFELIGDLLRETYLPPAFRAALYRVTAELPGIELLGEVEDPVGRTGIGIASPGPEIRHELIFNPETSALLGEREELVIDSKAARRAGLVPRTEMGSTTYLESAVVNSKMLRSLRVR